jgi:hypothetical protein
LPSGAPFELDVTTPGMYLHHRSEFGWPSDVVIPSFARAPELKHIIDQIPQVEPEAFSRLWAMIDPPWQPGVVYAPRGVATLWEPAERAPDALADLLGRRRALLLTTLAHTATTQELALRHAASPAGVSEHLAVLRRAG